MLTTAKITLPRVSLITFALKNKSSTAPRTRLAPIPTTITRTARPAQSAWVRGTRNKARQSAHQAPKDREDD